MWSNLLWYGTKGEQKDLERIQKVALRIILKDSYSTYSEALVLTGLDTLSSRRSQLCLNFAKKCLKGDKTKDMFPVNTNTTNTRNHEVYQVTNAKTGRLAKSAIPFMQRLLNANYKK